MQPLWKKLFLLLLALDLLVGGGLLLYRRSLSKRASEWTIKQVFEKGPQLLPSGFMAEALGLSQNNPLSFDLFSSESAEKELLRFPFIKRASVKKIEPSALLVDYTLRTPLFKVAGYVNLVIDSEGKTFPLEPFYSPKKLPLIRLSSENGEQDIKEAMSLIRALKEEKEPLRVLLIDLKDKEHPIWGKRMIVMALEYQQSIDNKIFRNTFLLKLSADQPLDSIQRFKIVKNSLPLEKRKILIDLRQPSLAFIKE